MTSRAKSPSANMANGSGRLRSYVQLMRPYQWTKNLAIFPPVVFSLNLFNLDVVATAFLGFLAFCVVASSVYTMNDLLDVENDRGHPRKKYRPIAAGVVGKFSAMAFSIVLLVTSLLMAYWVNMFLMIVILIYWVANFLYSVVLKETVIVDVMFIGLSFVLRVIAGTLISEVSPSNWLLLVTFFLALFLAVGKRRQELQLYIKNGEGSRPVLKEYASPMLEQLLPVLAGLTIIVYSIYAISQHAVGQFGSGLLVTVPFVVYGLFRYLHLIYRYGVGEDPADLLVKDRSMAVCVTLWAVLCVVIVYWGRVLQ